MNILSGDSFLLSQLSACESFGKDCSLIQREIEMALNLCFWMRKVSHESYKLGFSKRLNRRAITVTIVTMWPPAHSNWPITVHSVVLKYNQYWCIHVPSHTWPKRPRIVRRGIFSKKKNPFKMACKRYSFKNEIYKKDKNC